MKKYILLLYGIYFFSTAYASQTFQDNKSASMCGPIPAVCYPITTTGGMGIELVLLNQINNPSGTPAMLEDFTCTDSTWLTPGNSYTFSVTTGMTYEESVTAWIDFNNDGEFIPSEIIFRDSAIVYLHVGSVQIPANVVNLSIPIRMRVGSDYAGNPPLNSCNNAIYGQYEDYTIYFGSGSGIFENEMNSQVKLFPNPFHSSTTLSVEGEFKNAQMKIYNCMGTSVRQLDIDHRLTFIKSDGLPAGFYFFELFNEDRKQIGYGQFVIN